MANASATSAVLVAVETESRDLGELGDGGKPAAIPPIDDKQSPIRLTDHTGMLHMIPWALCKEWQVRCPPSSWIVIAHSLKGMEERIKACYEGNQKAKKKIENGDYTIFKDGAKILREHWSALIEPGCTIRIELQLRGRYGVDALDLEPDTASESDEDDLDDTDAREPVYKRDVEYRVDCFVKPERRHELPKFLFSTTNDDPKTMKRRAKRKQRFVLGEIETIHFRDEGRAQSKESVKIHGPKLGVGDSFARKKLQIGSDALLNALRSVAKYSSISPSDGYDSSDDDSDDDPFSVGTFSYPFTDLVHHRTELSDFKKENKGPRANHTPEYNAQCDRHIDLLIQYLENEPNLRLKSLESKWTKEVPTTTFATMWLLMKPGTDVYVREDGQLNAYVIDQLAGASDGSFRFQPNWSSRDRGHTIRVWNLIYDGRFITRVGKILRVPIFDGERDILSLPLFPTFFQDRQDGGARRRQLIDRGKKFFQYTKSPTFLEYTGPGLKLDRKKVSNYSNRNSITI